MNVENKHARSLSVISIIVSVLSLYCAIIGFLDETIYGSVIDTGVFKPSYMAGTISQDMITIVASILIIVLVAVYSKRKDARTISSIIGLLSFYFYAYGTYVISALYTSVYPVYMIIFTLSTFGIVIGVSGLSSKDIDRLYLPKWVRVANSVFLALIVFLFMPLWSISMIPYIQSHTVPEFYAIYILDLCIVLPFFICVIYMLLKNNKKAYILLGIALIKTITLIISVTIGEITFPAHGFGIDKVMVAVYSGIIVISMVLFVFYCLRLKREI